MAESAGGAGSGRVHGRTYLCGVPTDKCSGTSSTMHDKGRKLHASGEQAYSCYVRYMASIGYKEAPNHCFVPVEGDGPVILGCKKSKMPACRPGKGNRWQFQNNCEIINSAPNS